MSWHDVWDKAKASSPGDTATVIQAWKAKAPAKLLRKNWSMKTGFRKRVKAEALLPKTEEASDRGEQKIERQLLGKKGEFKQHSWDPDVNFYAAFHNVPYLNIRRGQIISDVFGFIGPGHVLNPVAVEVKVTAGTLWTAVIQNLQQVKLARANATNLAKYFSKLKGFEKAPEVVGSTGVASKREILRGTWGMVVAPASYYDKAKATNIYAAVEELLAKLIEEGCDARIMLYTMEKETGSKLAFLDGYRPWAK